jgi:hypothetical protein
MKYIRPSHLALALLASTVLLDPAKFVDPANACCGGGMSPPSVAPPSVRPSTPNVNINIPRGPEVRVNPGTPRNSGGGDSGGGGRTTKTSSGGESGGKSGGKSSGGGGGSKSGGGGGDVGGGYAEVPEDDPGESTKAGGGGIAAVDTLDPCGCGPNMGPAPNESSSGGSPPTPGPWKTGKEGLQEYLDELNAETERLNAQVEAANAKIAGLTQIFKEEVGDDKIVTGTPGTDGFLPIISGYMSPTAGPLNDAIDARNGLVNLVNANREAKAMVRAELFGKPKVTFWQWLGGK